MTDEISGLIRRSWRVLAGWMSLIGASLIGFLLTEGTSYHHLATGILLCSSTLSILLVLFDGAWRLFVGNER
ncbi:MULTISPECIES: hypothetical protein [unclassified Bradyrhizobium]